MSASNWAICPKCLGAAQHVHLDECERVHALFDQIPAEEWRAQLAALEAVDPEIYRTFREDYEIYGAEKGEIIVRYGGACENCGLSAELSANRRFWTGGT